MKVFAENMRAQKGGRRHRQAQRPREIKSGVQEAADRSIIRRGGSSFIRPSASPRQVCEPLVKVSALQHCARGGQHENTQEGRLLGKARRAAARASHPSGPRSRTARRACAQNVRLNLAFDCAGFDVEQAFPHQREGLKTVEPLADDSAQMFLPQPSVKTTPPKSSPPRRI